MASGLEANMAHGRPTCRRRLQHGGRILNMAHGSHSTCRAPMSHGLPTSQAQTTKRPTAPRVRFRTWVPVFKILVLVSSSYPLLSAKVIANSL